MAPEMIEGKSYKGEDVDLFSAVIILFIMVSGSPPFNFADQNRCSFYKMIANKEWRKFWQFHSKGKSINHQIFNENFRNLI